MCVNRRSKLALENVRYVIRLSPKAARFAARACEVLAEQCAADDEDPHAEMDASYYASIAASIREQSCE